MNLRIAVGLLFIFGCTFITPTASLQAADNEPRQLSKREEKRRLKQLRKELAAPFKRWLDQDVLYIITGEERQAFLRLSTDIERENFIEQFWLRRDPTPDTIENEYREEHYRRIAYANQHYASGIPGWKADRGRIYITFGPPDEIESHPSGGMYQRPYDEGGGFTSTYPFEIWRYRYLEGVGPGTDILIEFVDPTMTGEYRLTIDPSEKDALLHVPGAGLTLAEEMGLSTKADRFSRTDGTRMGSPVGGGQSIRYNQFERLQLYADLHKPPPIKFKDLEAVVDSNIEYNTLPFEVDVDYVKITDNSVLTGITIQLENRDLMFKEENGLHKAMVNVYGRITTVTRRLQTHFDDPVVIETTSERLQGEVNRKSIYNKALPLAPGMYRLQLVIKDVIGETISTHHMALHVPTFDDENLAYSSLILADKIERVPTRSLGTGQFVLGASKVRPRLGEEFKSDETMGIYVEVYNLGEDEETAAPKGTVTYQIAKASAPEEYVVDFTEDISTIRGASAGQLTIEKILPLKTFEPGDYLLNMKVEDQVKNEVLTPTAKFKVK